MKTDGNRASVRAFGIRSRLARFRHSAGSPDRDPLFFAAGTAVAASLALLLFPRPPFPRFVAAPLALVAIVRLLAPLFRRGRWVKKASPALDLLALAALGWLVCRLGLEDAWRSGNAWFFRHPVGGAAYLLVAFAIAAFAARSRIVAALFAAAAAAWLFAALPLALLGSGSEAAFRAPFASLYSTMVQVSGGRALLGDFPAPDGLFAHFLRPLFTAVPLSIPSFSMTLGALTLLSLSGAARFLFLSMRSRSLAGIATLSFFFFACAGAFPDFPHWPLRSLVPCLLLAFAPAYFRKPSVAASLAAWIGLSIGALWNLDAGAGTLLAWLATLSYGELLAAPSRKAAAPILKHGAACGIALAATGCFFWSAVHARSGVSVDFRDLFRSARFPFAAEMPIPRFAIYLSGLATSIAAVFRARGAGWVGGSRFPKLVFLLTALGFALPWAEYPAFLLIAICTDRLLDLWSVHRRSWTELALLFVGLAALLPGPWKAVEGIEPLRRSAVERWSVFRQETRSPFASEAETIRRHARPGERILLLSAFPAEIFRLSGTTFDCVSSGSKPFDGADLAKLDDCLRKPGRRMVYLDSSGSRVAGAEALQAEERVRERYRKVDQSEDGKLVVYQKDE